jgi:hypothetical protein
MTLLQKIGMGYFVVLLGAALLNYIPGVADSDGLVFGVFALDIYDDTLHFFSAIWALCAAVLSHHSTRRFLLIFGTLYLGDGVLGLITGSGYLDFGIFNNGILDLTFGFKVAANIPHISLGGFAVFSGLYLDRT